MGALCCYCVIGRKQSALFNANTVILSKEINDTKTRSLDRVGSVSTTVNSAVSVPDDAMDTTTDIKTADASSIPHDQFNGGINRSSLSQIDNADIICEEEETKKDSDDDDIYSDPGSMDRKRAQTAGSMVEMESMEQKYDQ